MWSDWWAAHRAEIYLELWMGGAMVVIGATWTLVVKRRKL